ncbi:MAG: hypothetical protein DI537_51285, partial [Stutzerimonas stutzeri]
MTSETTQRAERLIAMIATHQPPALPRTAVINPATATAFATFAYADAGHLDAVVDAAVRAAGGWAQASLATRREAIHRIAAIIEREAEALAALLTLEQGKPL